LKVPAYDAETGGTNKLETSDGLSRRSSRLTISTLELTEHPSDTGGMLGMLHLDACSLVLGVISVQPYATVHLTHVRSFQPVSSP
jgi:hypothetical protein